MSRTPNDELVECVTSRSIGMEYTAEEKLKLQESSRRTGLNLNGLTKSVPPNTKVFLSRKDAKKLQDAGAVKIVL